MKKLVFLLILLLSKSAVTAQLSFDATETPITVTPEANTGLEHIYILPSTNNVQVFYQASSATASVEWSRFSNLGGAYNEPVQFERNDDICSIKLNNDDIGFIIKDESRYHYYWIVNYDNHTMTIDQASVNVLESDCVMTAIDIIGSANPITYYTITGIPRELSREIMVTYNTLQWDGDNQTYQNRHITKELSSLSNTIRIEAPLCNTVFVIEGDRFMKAWGTPITASTDVYYTTAIDVNTYATQVQHENDNEISDTSSELGGSAPVEITFTAITTDAVAYREWQISHTPDFDIIDLRFNADEVTYTFHDYGIAYVRFIAANASADCDWTSETYQVSIGDSKLTCPNAFSPGASEGINDEWKVSYRSIVDFECHIFNQWGIELFSTTDPSVGWNGKHRGKLVPAGVYYYVIKARGADGKNYSLSGDINIINFKKGNPRHNSDL